MLRELLEQLVTTAYQDMEGVMLNKKGYKLRHKELVDRYEKAIKEEMGLKDE